MSVGNYIPFGLRPDGSLIDPFTADRGLACNCVCPGCRQPLMARQGEIRVHHFSQVGDRGCSNGQTSALLLAAKQVLRTHRRIEMPELVVTATDTPRFGRPRHRSSRHPQPRWDLNSVELAREVAGHRADAYCIRLDGAAGIVEFRISAKASDEKRRAYRDADLPAVEVDLRPLVSKALTLEELAKEICDSSSNREWLHHPDAAALEQQLMTNLQVLRPAPAQTPLAPRRGAGPPVYFRSGTNLGMLDAERLAIRREHERHRALTLEQKLAELQAALGAPPDAWPELFAAVKPNASPAINAPSPLWQGAVFQEFILWTLLDARKRECGFSAASVNGWVWARFDASPGESMTGIISEVLRFLGHLVNCGYLRLSGDKYFVIRDSLPPDGG